MKTNVTEGTNERSVEGKRVIKGQQKHIHYDHMPYVEVQWPV